MGALLTQFMNRFPYTDFHELNADWMIRTMMELINQVENFVSLNAIKYADPIQWNITKQYEKNTVVIDPLTGTAYISVQPVPMGVALTNTDYWTVVFDLGSFVVRAAKNFSNNYEAETTLTATFPSSVDQWLVWGDTLYVVISPIIAGDQYVIDSNIKRITVEEVCDALAQAIQNVQNNVDALDTKVGDLNDLSTTDKTSVILAINEVVSALAQEIIDRGNADDAINERIDNRRLYNVRDYGAVGDGITDDTQAFIDAIADMDAIAGGALIIPEGTYLIKNTIAISKPVSILGDNRYNTILICDNVGTLFDCTGAYGLTVRDIRINGTKTSAKAFNLAGNSFYWTIDTCIIHDFDEGVHVDYAPYGCLNNCLLYNANYDVYVQNTDNMDEGDSVFTNNEFLTSEYSNIHLYFASSGGDKIANNKFNGGAYGCIIEFQNGIYTVDFEFSNNSIENTTNEGVKINMIGTGHVANVVITGNQFDTYGACVLASGVVENLVISGNDLNSTSTRCVWLDTGVDNAIVTGNSFRGYAGIYTNGDAYDATIEIGDNVFNVSTLKFERASAYAAGNIKHKIVDVMHAQNKSITFDLSAYVGLIVNVDVAGTIANVGACASSYKYAILNDTGNVVIRELNRDIAANDIYHADVPVSSGFASVAKMTGTAIVVDVDSNNQNVPITDGSADVATSISTMNVRGTNTTNDPLAISLTNAGNTFTLSVGHASEIVDATISITFDGFVKSF